MKKIKIPVSIPEGFAVIVTAFVTFVAYRAAYWHMGRAEGAMTGIAVMFGLMAGVGLYTTLSIRNHSFYSDCDQNHDIEPHTGRHLPAWYLLIAERAEDK